MNSIYTVHTFKKRGNMSIFRSEERKKKDDCGVENNIQSALKRKQTRLENSLN